MSAVLLLLVSLGLGVLFARSGQLPRAAPAVINGWVLRVALPALILLQVPELKPEAALVFPALAPWLVFGGAALLLPLAARRFGWSREQTGALVLTCGLGNTSFIGLPMIEALHGRSALGPAIIADQVGSFVALATGGVALAAWYAGRQASAGELLRRVAFFPPFLALLVAVLVRYLGGWPEGLLPVLERLSATLTPLALFSVGLQFRFSAFGAYAGPLFLGLGWKLGLAPLLVLGLAWVIGSWGLAVQVGILQCAMGPMISAGILAQEYRLAPELANAVVSLGVLLSLATVPLWSAALF